MLQHKKKPTKSTNFYFKILLCYWSTAIFCFICIDKLKQEWSVKSLNNLSSKTIENIKFK